MNASTLALAVGTLIPPAAASAQAVAATEPRDDASPDAESGSANSTIFVTARRFQERLQDVPINISVITGEEISRRGIDNLMELAKNTVGFSFESITPFVVQPTIRGQTNLRATSPVQNVPFNIDGIYLQRGYMIDQALLSLDQVEIVKGPQSALYGRNAFAGVINLQTRAPDLARIQAEVSSTVGNGGRFDARGLISIPIIEDRLAVLASVAHSQFDGIWRNEHPLANDRGATTNGRLGGWDKQTYQFRAIAKPIDDLTIDAMYIRTERLIEQLPSYAAGTTGVGTNFNTLNASPIGGQNRLLVGELPPLPVLAPGEVRRPGLIIDPRAFGLRGPTEIVSAKVQYDLSPAWSALYQFGFTRAEVEARGSPLRDPTVPIPPFLAGPNLTLFDSSGNESEFRGWSHEVRFSFNDGGPLRLLFGGNYSVTSDIESNGSELAPANSLVQPSPNFFFPLGPGLPFPTSQLQRNTNLVRDEKIYSIFGFVGYSPDDRWDITLEGRYTIEDQVNVDRLTREPTNAAIQALVPPRQEQTLRFFAPRASISYKVTDGNLLYASAGRGIKSGGFNGFVPFVPQRTYDPETNWTYEIGSKNQFLNGRLTANVALYHTVWRNLQTNGVRLQANGTAPPFLFIVPSLIENIGGVNVWGAEVELAYRVNEWLTLDAGGNYARSRYTDSTVSQRFGASGNCDGVVCAFVPDPVIGRALPLGGNQLERVPEFDAVFGASFNGSFANGNSWFGRIGGTYQSRQFIDEANLAFVPGRLLFNANAGVDLGLVNLNLWAKNILDKQYVSSSLFLIGTNGALSASYVPTLGDRRTFGLTATMRF